MADRTNDKNDRWPDMGLQLIDAVLVECRTSDDGAEMYKMNDAGLYEPNPRASEKPSNYGRVLVLPSLVTEDRFTNVAKTLHVGDTVFFPVTKSYNFIPHDSVRNVKWLIIPLYDIDAVVVLN